VYQPLRLYRPPSQFHLLLLRRVPLCLSDFDIDILLYLHRIQHSTRLPILETTGYIDSKVLRWSPYRPLLMYLCTSARRGTLWIRCQLRLLLVCVQRDTRHFSCCEIRFHVRTLVSRIHGLSRRRGSDHYPCGFF
jgi:hypothetical protein